MNQRIICYGLSDGQVSMLEAALPDGYTLNTTKCVTDLLVTDIVCTIIDGTVLHEDARRALFAYYMDLGERLDETVVWLKDLCVPDLPSFVYCEDLLHLLLDLNRILAQAQARYDTMQMYIGEYAALPKCAIAESMEADIHAAMHRKYGAEPDAAISRQVRQELTALLEADGLAQLAAAYEFATWLKRNNYLYRFGGSAANGLIPYLLGIHEVNPLSPHLYCHRCKKLNWRPRYKDGFRIPSDLCPNCGELTEGDGHHLVWQMYASYGAEPSYVFYLPPALEPTINAWLDNHWLRQYMEDQWNTMQPYEDHLVRGNMHFRFDYDNEDNAKEARLYWEDVFFYLRKHGFADKDAFRSMNSVRKGKGLPLITDEIKIAPDYWKAEYFMHENRLPSRAQLLQWQFFKRKKRTACLAKGRKG